MTAQPQPNEVFHKEWLHTRAEELGIRPPTLAMRIFRGKHPKPTVRRVNQRVIFVVKHEDVQ